MRDDPDPPPVAGGARPVVDVAGMDDEAGREAEDLAREREVLRPVLPQRRDALVEDAVGEQPPDDAVLALHRVEVAVPVAAPDGQAGDEVVEDEVVEDDEAGRRRRASTIQAVRVGVVADVVEAQVGAARRPLLPALHDLQLDALLQSRHEQRRVVGDPRRARAASG